MTVQNSHNPSCLPCFRLFIGREKGSTIKASMPVPKLSHSFLSFVQSSVNPTHTSTTVCGIYAFIGVPWLLVLRCLFEWESSGDWFGNWHRCAESAAVISWVPRRLLFLVVWTQTPLLAACCWENRYLSLRTQRLAVFWGICRKFHQPDKYGTQGFLRCVRK